MEEDIEHLEDIKENFEYSLEHRTSLTNEEYLNAHRKSLAISNILNELDRLQKENKLYKHRLEVANEFIESRIDGMIPEHYDDLKYIINECDINSTW